MKRYLIIGCAALLTAVSCGTQQTQQTETTSVYSLKGEWEVVSVDYDKKFKIKPFHEGADAKCFVGSTWKLIPNNYSGSYTLHGGSSCPEVYQAIKFEVTKNKEFRFKKLKENVKAKNITEGYVLQLENHPENSFTLTQNLSFEGKNLTVHYQFRRIK